MKKKLLSLFLCTVMVLSMVLTAPPAAWAADGLTVTGGKSFSGPTDQLCMERALDAVPLSFEATISVPKGSARAGHIVSNYAKGAIDGEFDSTREYVDIEIFNNGNPALYWQESHASNSKHVKMSIVFDEVNVATDKFVHLAITYDPATDLASCYVDGELKQTIVNGNLEPTVPDGPMKIGGDYRYESYPTTHKNYNGQYFKGTIANVSVWSSILTATDVKAHYDALCTDSSAIPTAGTGLLGSWDLTAPDANGDYADKSANGNDVYVFYDWLTDIDMAEGDYSMVVMPDPQVLVEYSPESFYTVTKWIADNADDLNIKGVIGVGDMVDDDSKAAQWNVSKTGMDMIDAAGVAWMPMRGNHERHSDTFNEIYKYDELSRKSWFGGSYQEGSLDHTYWFITEGGREYMVLSLGWAPSWDVLDWAEELVKSFPEKNVIITAHSYMYWDGTLVDKNDGSCVNNYSGFEGYPEGQDIWDRLSKYENVAMGFGGHIGSSDLITYVDKNGAGKDVTNMLVNSQNMDYDGCNVGLVCVLTFHNDSDTVDVNWYSPVREAFFRERNQFSFTVPHVAENETGVIKTKLKIAVINCGTHRPLNYTVETWTAFDEALTVAENLLENDNATQKQVDDAEQALIAAKAGLVKRQGLTFSAAAKNYAQFSKPMVIPETVEVWFQIPEGYNKRALLCGGYGYGGNTDTEIFWGIDYYTDGKLYWWEEAAGRELSEELISKDETDGEYKVNTGEWMLLSVVRDQEDECIRTYINGELVHTLTDLSAQKNPTVNKNVLDYTTGKTTTQPIRLGRDYGKTIKTYEGMIGEMRVYSDDRTAEEIKAGYLNDIKGEENRDDTYLSDANLTGCWRLRDLKDDEAHAHTFANLANGTGADAELTISTVGFTSARDTSALEAEIAAAKALTEADYTTDSWAALETELAAAEAVVADTANTQKEVAQSLIDLRAAVAALVERGDKTELQKAVDDAKALTEADYTTATWADVEEALADAEAVLADVDALQPAIDAAKKALTDAVAALVERGDKTELQKAVNDAKALDEADYTTATWADVEETLADAEAVLADVDALQPAIDAAEKALEDAVAALVERGDKTELQKAVDDAKALDEADYTTATWADVEDALADAEEVLAEEDALQPAIDSAKKALDDAVAALVKRGDKTELAKAVKAATALDKDDYTADTWAAVEDALTDAELVLAEEDATQRDVDAAEKALEDAVAALKKPVTGPVTGDSAPIVLWTILLCLSAAAVVILKKKEREAAE